MKLEAAGSGRAARYERWIKGKPGRFLISGPASSSTLGY
jgi:hypothetical protein